MQERHTLGARSESKHTFPARLHVLLAREAQVGLVFRRGPSKQVCTFLWDRTTHRFTLGQWLKGRIYERRSDLSPDGKHVIYFAMNGQWQSATGGSWTAISRAPWLTAIALFGKGNCWEGGGLFATDKRYWLNDRYFSPSHVLLDSSAVSMDPSCAPKQQFNAEDTGVYYPRLLRDGWRLVERRSHGKWNDDVIFDKPLNKRWTLRKIAHEQIGAPPGKGCYWDEHELRDDAGTVHAQPTWEWAEVDGNQLLWSERGCLYQGGSKSDDPVGRRKLLHDFNGYRFQEAVAPYAARAPRRK